MIKLAVFGAPVSQSRSPAIHAMFADQFSLDVDYRAIEATEATFVALVRQLANSGGLGCNITAPFKSQAWRLARRCSPSARRAEVANTLRFDSDNDWFADNTDGRGLLRDLTDRLEFNSENARIAIIGAGGATAGILGDLLDQHPADVVVANRTIERALSLVDTFGEPLSAIALADLADADPFDLLINATSLGHSGKHPGLPSSLFHTDTLVYDLNYGPASQPLSAFCRDAGVRFSDGLGMLVEQAALSFEIWTGQEPSTGPVLKALRKDLPATI